MIHGHILDAWTREPDRSSAAFQHLTTFGGIGAPLFLWLAGVAVVLAGERTAARTGSRRLGARRVVRRGLEIFALAFLFRLQAFLISRGSQLITLLRVDILNIMGPSIAAAGVVWGLCRRWSTALVVFSAVTVGLAMATPLVRTAAWVDVLPDWFQWYLRPSGPHTTFTGLPWAGFVFGGAACGVLIARAKDEAAERKVLTRLAVAGAVLVVAGFYTSSRPTIYTTGAASFWTSSPTYFAIRCGLLALILSIVYALADAAAQWGIRLAPLEQLGRSSLFVYWIHIELIYGSPAAAARHRLPLWEMELAFVVFAVVMYLAVLLRDRLALAWRDWRREPAAAYGS